MKAVIVVPTYNEKQNILKLISRIRSETRGIKDWKIEILVVDDNSPDGTAAVVNKAKPKGVTVLVRSKKIGLGAAYLSGMKEAFEKRNADVVVTMDADLSHNPLYLTQFLAKIINGSEFVIGSRYIKGGAIPKSWGIHRKILSVGGNFITSLFFEAKVSDWTSGYRAITKQVYKHVIPKLEDKSEARGYTFNISFAYHTLEAGFKYGEVPIKFTDRTAGKSKLGLEYLIHTPVFLIRTRLKSLYQV